MVWQWSSTLFNGFRSSRLTVKSPIFYSGDRSDRQFPVKLINGSDSFDLDKTAFFQTSENFCQLLIFNEHFHADRICKITDRKNDDRPFILDLTGIQTDDLTMKGNFSHFFHDLIQADRSSSKFLP